MGDLRFLESRPGDEQALTGAPIPDEDGALDDLSQLEGLESEDPEASKE